MGGSFSKSDKCEEYKKKIHRLNHELREYKSGRMLPINSGDPYNEYSGGKLKPYKKKLRKTRKRKE
jgi:hypothetical protein